MTRDEQIAQLKPGDSVVLRGVMGPRTLVAVAGDVVVYAMAYGGSSAQVRHIDDLLLPEPPPKPKAVPGVRYRCAGDPNYSPRRVGTFDGRLSDGWDSEDFDPAVWTPIDDKDSYEAAQFHL